MIVDQLTLRCGIWLELSGDNSNIIKLQILQEALKAVEEVKKV